MMFALISFSCIREKKSLAAFVVVQERKPPVAQLIVIFKFKWLESSLKKGETLPLLFEKGLGSNNWLENTKANTHWILDDHSNLKMAAVTILNM